MDTITQEQYDELIKRYNHTYTLQHEGKTFTPDGVVSPSISNDEIAQIEFYEWIHNPPERYFIYISEKNHTATTWTGIVLGRVQFGREYQTPAYGWPSTRVPVTVIGNNGKRYYGTYYKSSGDYARIRLYKNQD